jgi:hypothetical protein
MRPKGNNKQRLYRKLHRVLRVTERDTIYQQRLASLFCSTFQKKTENVEESIVKAHLIIPNLYPSLSCENE